MNDSAARSLEHRGCKLTYWVRGNGPPVLFIQGVGVCGSGWWPQVEALSSEYRCLWFDNRGIGQSLPLGCPLTVEQMAEDAIHILDAEQWKSAHIVGHSLGGLIALCLALDARERVRSLALLCTFSRGSDATKVSPSMIWTGLRTRIGTRRQRRSAFLSLVMPRPYLQSKDSDSVAADLAPLFGHDLADQPPISMKQLSAARRYDATSRLSELRGVPTLVVSAEHDRIARTAYGRALAAAIPGSHYFELTGVAHGVPMHQPDTINDLLRRHF